MHGKIEVGGARLDTLSDLGAVEGVPDIRNDRASFEEVVRSGHPSNVLRGAPAPRASATTWLRRTRRPWPGNAAADYGMHVPIPVDPAELTPVVGSLTGRP
jgi:hypothetical protein